MNGPQSTSVLKCTVILFMMDDDCAFEHQGKKATFEINYY